MGDPWKHRSRGMSCITCIWYMEKEREKSIKGALCLGRCRKRAPTMDGYPVVFEEDWCGNHKLDENAI